ncbi:MAG: GNAT family N-acetyltransferase [Cohaesibacter sp.]|nr:GNAT family N-acetyltransferase [Cohaesibacter sp.]MCV6603038.1 GNAT family N-acetyltransferase [Cohaesibacter sp.]
MSEQSLHLEVCHSIAQIGQESWSICCNDTPKAADNPFLTYAFLSALEESGCVSEQSGWLPHHLVLKDEKDTILACLPLYLKAHSQGEYVFDHGWADAYERAGGRYYPKLQSSLPFTPVTAPKLLTRRELNPDMATKAFASGLKQVCERYHISSVHLTFLPQTEKSRWEKQDFLIRRDRQFHWINQDYDSFDDFLTDLASRKRKAIKKERRQAQNHGLTIIKKRGDEISEQDWDSFFAFYMDTGARKWGRPYLTRAFFAMLSERMSDNLLLFIAKNGENPVAGALNFIGKDTLYGRYWGAIGDYPSLHFELCYHQAIEWAIEHGYKSVEAGAQGEHKLARGYIPQTTWSCHWIDNPSFRQAVEDYLQAERREAAAEQDFLTDLAPFKKG